MNKFKQILNTLESVYQDKILENILYCTYRFFNEISCDFAYSFLQKVTYDKVSENIVKDTYSDIKNTNYEFLKPEDIFIMFFSKVYDINMSDVDNFLSERGVKGTHLSTYSENDEPMTFEEMIVVFKDINENNEDKEHDIYHVVKSVYENEKNGIEYITLYTVYQKKELKDILIKCYNYLSDKYSLSLAETFLGRILFDKTTIQSVNDTYEHLRHLNYVGNIEKIRLFIAVVFHVNLSSLEDYLSNNININKGTHLSTYPEETNNNYEFVNHPSHYNEWSMEVIDMMEKIYGTENTIMWCEMTAYKYAMRMGFKPTDDIQQEIDKRNWYLNKAKELKQKLEEKLD